MTTPANPFSAAPVPGLSDLLAMVDTVGQAQTDLFARIIPGQLDLPDPGGWTTREILSHVVGSWQRVPLWASFFLDGDPTVPVPIFPHDPFWMREWETAPLAAFKLSLAAAIAGNKAFLQTLDTEALHRTHPTPFGEITLGAFLHINYQLHLGGGHTPQLHALLHH